MKNSSLVLAIAASVALALSGCGGGGSGGTRPIADGGSMMPSDGGSMMPSDGGSMMPSDGSTTPVASSPAQVRESARSSVIDVVSNARTAFGSVVAYTGAEVTGIGSSFDGQRVTATINRRGTSPVNLDTDGTYFDYGNEPSLVGLPGRTGRVRYVFDHTNTSATLGLLAVDWANNDSNDYLAGGYWLHVEANPATLEVGAFVDGPELSLSNPPSLPISGTASYAGSSAGMYAFKYGSDSPDASPGSEELGEFSAVATLTADFSAGTIEGCVGCQGQALVSGVTYHSNTGQTETFEDYATDWRVNFGSVPINRSNGTFQGTNVNVSHPLATVTQSSGIWAGQFSNRSNSSGNPRLAAGTFGGQATTSGGSRATFIGAFAAGNQ